MDASTLREKTDAYLDGALSPDEEARLRADPEIAAEFDAADEVRRILTEEYAACDVPLGAQAAWRNAVRKEARAGRIRRTAIRMTSAAAAVAVLALSASFLFGSEKSPLRRRVAALPGGEQATAVGITADDGAPTEGLAAAKSAPDSEDRVMFAALTETNGADGGIEEAYAADTKVAVSNAVPVDYTQASGFALRAARTLSNDVNRPARVTVSVPDSDMDTMLRTVEDKARETGGSVWSYTVCEEEDECEIVASVSASQVDEFVLMLGSASAQQENTGEGDDTCKVVIRFSGSEAPESGEFAPVESVQAVQ